MGCETKWFRGRCTFQGVALEIRGSAFPVWVNCASQQPLSRIGLVLVSAKIQTHHLVRCACRLLTTLMSQRLSRVSSGSGSSIRWSWPYGIFRLLTQPRRLSIATFSVANTSRRTAVVIWPAGHLQPTARTAVILGRNFRPYSSVNREDARESGRFEEDKDFTPAQLEHQARLESNAQTLCGILAGPRTIDPSRLIAERTQRLLDNPQDGSRSRTSGPTVALLLAQIRACSGATDLERVINVTLPAKQIDDEEFDARYSKAAQILNHPHTVRLLLSRLNRKPQPRYEMTVLTLLIDRLRKAKLLRPIDGQLFRAALLKAASYHVLEAAQAFLPFVVLGTDSHTINDDAAVERKLPPTGNKPIRNNKSFELVPNEKYPLARHRLAVVTPMHRFLEDLRKGVEDGSPFTGARHPKAVIHLLETTLERFSGSGNVEQSIFQNWDVLFPWISLLAECNGTMQMRTIWRTLEESLKPGLLYETGPILATLSSQLPAFFIHMFFRAGDPDSAWEIYKSYGREKRPSGISNNEHRRVYKKMPIHNSVWNALIAHLEYKPTLDSDLERAFKHALHRRYQREIENLESLLSLTWKSSIGAHTYGPDLFETLQRKPRAAKHTVSGRPLHTSKWPATTVPDENPWGSDHEKSVNNDHESWARLPFILSPEGRKAAQLEAEKSASVGSI